MFVFKNIDRKTTPSKKLKKALPFIQPFLNKKLLLNMADKLHKKYPFAECDMVDDAEHIFTLAKHKLYRSDFEEFIYHDFEGGKFRIPKNYDKILTATYGDYMTPPPKEKQITHHSNNCYWK